MNPYNILNVKKDASENDIVLAYEKLKEQYNNKNYNGDPYFAKVSLAEINKAYRILSNPKKRAKYDKEFASYLDDEDSFYSAGTGADNFIIFWVFFCIFAIFVIIPLVYVLSAMSIFN